MIYFPVTNWVMGILQNSPVLTKPWNVMEWLYLVLCYKCWLLMLIYITPAVDRHLWPYPLQNILLVCLFVIAKQIAVKAHRKYKPLHAVVLLCFSKHQLFCMEMMSRWRSILLRWPRNLSIVWVSDSDVMRTCWQLRSGLSTMGVIITLFVRTGVIVNAPLPFPPTVALDSMIFRHLRRRLRNGEFIINTKFWNYLTRNTVLTD